MIERVRADKNFDWERNLSQWGEKSKTIIILGLVNEILERTQADFGFKSWVIFGSLDFTKKYSLNMDKYIEKDMYINKNKIIPNKG